jgi:hypothetical protein
MGISPRRYTAVGLLHTRAKCAWLQRSKLEYDDLPSGLASNFDLRPYLMISRYDGFKAAGEPVVREVLTAHPGTLGRGLHSSTSQLNLSRF